MSTPKLIDCGAGVTLERGVPIRMSDGITLIADHYYPPTPGPNPTLLMRQPYGRDIASTVVYAHPVWFARHGYNVVIQDVRGRGDSEGHFYPFRHERKDGAETIAALRDRTESNGKFGMYGFSYQGMTQLLAAAEAPEGLLCIAPAQTAHDLYHGWFYSGGALRLASSLGWGLQMLKADARRRNHREDSDRLEQAWANLPAQYLATPYAAHPAIQDEDLPTYVRDWFKHDTPGEYWSAMDVSRSIDIVNLNIPALHLSGWYDTYLKGSIDGFRAMHHHANQYLVAGPWVHIPWGNRIGPADLGPEANLDTDALLLLWFNHWLKDTNEFAHEPRVRHFALNENRWHAAESWPTPTQTLYLHSEGRANSSKGDGTLTSIAPSIPEAPDLFNYDPEVPVMAPGGPTNTSGPTNQAAAELGNNLLTYTTHPLEYAVRIFGTPQVTLHASTSAPTSDLVAKLICVKPNGDATFLCIGILRSRHTPDIPHLWAFDLDPTSCLFATGDRIRLEIASSAYPLFDRNPNNHTPPRLADSWNWQRSTQTLFHDPARPSALHLPVIPA
ncbi:CocE/NonD family hydrolase [Granulicella sibirica]|uniref:Peptidase S15 n=1 Tax=Granulicella sibirica TaxID=2479048 RepID=A0A4Q0T3H1_9BACT|nr:CocE/NonD family hydrolase [Granulicella sibirica]RXH57817.1 Peptidase S15 [Granulicella sibirica]